MRQSTKTAAAEIYAIDKDFGMLVSQYTVGIIERLTEFVNRQEDYMPDVEFCADEILGRSGTISQLLEIVAPLFQNDILVLNKLIEILDTWGNEVLVFNRKHGFDRHQTPLVSELPKEE